MSDLKKQIIIERIQKNIDAVDVAGYIKEEVKSLLDNFHYYKLKNLYKNFDFLNDYLSYLDYKNTIQIRESILSQEGMNEGNIINLQYYLSERGKHYLSKFITNVNVINNSYYLNKIILGLRGFIVLSIGEFCNASNTRLHINSYLWAKEMSKVEDYFK